MDPILMWAVVVAAFAVAIFMLLKKMDITITMLLMGVILMFIAMATGNSIAVEGFESSGIPCSTRCSQ